MFVFPMSGNSSRFFRAGFTQPKYELPARGKTLFSHTVRGFERYFDRSKFLFIVRDEFDSSAFVEAQCKLIGLRDFDIVALPKPTRGQAETVAIGLERAAVPDCEPIGVFNIDTLRENFTLPEFTQNPDENYGGYIEVVKTTGEHWSFARLSSEGNRVVEVREKKRISDLCSTGFYHFATAAHFLKAYNSNCLAGSEAEAAEKYVAPLYNVLIADGFHILANEIDESEVTFYGTPEEYMSFKDGGLIP